MDYIVTRHNSAVEWLNQRGFSGEVIQHLDIDNIPEGNHTFIGVFPIHIIDNLLLQGHRVYVLVMPQIPKELRGQELTSETMERFGAKILKVNSLELEEIL